MLQVQKKIDETMDALIDFEKQSPQRVERPTRSELKQIRRGDYAKVFLKCGSKVWVWVAGQENNGRFDGRVESAPDHVAGRGDYFTFEKRHVAELV